MQADEVELLELQSVLLEHVLALKISLETPAIARNPGAALEQVNGHFDMLRRASHSAAMTATESDNAEASRSKSHEPHLQFVPLLTALESAPEPA